MIFEPVIPWGWLGVVAAACLVLFCFLLSRGTRSFRPRTRMLVSAAYLAGIAGILCLLANPGREETLTVHSRPVWIVALDASSSMTAPMQSSGGGGSRLDAARRDLKSIASLAPDGVDVRWVSVKDVSSSLPDAGALALVKADGGSSPLSRSLAALLEDERSGGRAPSGLILLSDGRDTEPAHLGRLAREAGNLGVPVHTLCYGEKWEAPRLTLEATKTIIHSFPGNTVQAPARVRNRKLGPVQTAVSLLDAGGRVLDRKVVNVAGDADAVVNFTLKCPPESAHFSLKCDAVPGDESGPEGRETLFSVQTMRSRIRVFMAEGAPYWDSKFLAQFLRRQPSFDVRSIHMLTQDRFYSINTGEETGAEADGESIPSSLEDFLRFDMVILGKGAERIITPARAAALHSFVRDYGGLLVFARGKSYAGRFPEMEALEPFAWKAPFPGDHQLTPSPEGVKDGLFGVVLPGTGADVWRSLPPLEDSWDVERIFPGTRVAARSPDGRLPLLAVKRVGMGAAGMINGDGLWKWDFFPEALRLGNWYEDFWGQFLPWMRTAAEFLPGYDLSLHVERASVEPGVPVSFSMSWRGRGRPSGLSVELADIRDPEKTIFSAVARQDSSRGGLPRWNGVFTSPGPGRYILRARMAGNGASPMPDVCLDVPEPPGERDNLDADAAFLASMSELTGGRRLTREELDGTLSAMMEPPPDYTSREEAFFPLWNRWYVLLVLAVLPALYWWVRRRNGLL